LSAQPFFPFPRRPSFRTTYARVKLVPASGFNNVSGEIFLEQGHPQAPVFIRGLVVGLEPGNHGFHVHAKGQISNDCLDAGGHFNPFKKSHGDPNASATPFADGQRHVGDLGNIRTLSRAHATQVFKIDEVVSLQKGQTSTILGKSLVIHQSEDDLGRGGNEDSLKTGNAGKRVACGIIEKI